MNKNHLPVALLLMITLLVFSGCPSNSGVPDIIGRDTAVDSYSDIEFGDGDTVVDGDSDIGFGDGDTDSPSCGGYTRLTQWPSDGVLIHFVAAGNHAHVYITNTEAINHVQAWLSNQSSNLGIPGGPIEPNNLYNPGYSYRLQPDKVRFRDMWAEVCDATPCYIESDSSAWFSSPTTWCPWSFHAVEIWECSGSGCSSVYKE